MLKDHPASQTIFHFQASKSLAEPLKSLFLKIFELSNYTDKLKLTFQSCQMIGKDHMVMMLSSEAF